MCMLCGLSHFLRMVTPDQQPKWNALDGKIDRRSHTAEYTIVDKVPRYTWDTTSTLWHLICTISARYLCPHSCRNPMGRTGMIGRGLLGKWGPNHAADPVVTRYIVYSEIQRIHSLYTFELAGHFCKWGDDKQINQHCKHITGIAEAI